MENNNGSKKLDIGIINADNTIGKNSERGEFETSTISKQDVYEMISEKLEESIEIMNKKLETLSTNINNIMAKLDGNTVQRDVNNELPK